MVYRLQGHCRLLPEIGIQLRGLWKSTNRLPTLYCSKLANGLLTSNFGYSTKIRKKSVNRMPTSDYSQSALGLPTLILVVTIQDWGEAGKWNADFSTVAVWVEFGRQFADFSCFLENGGVDSKVDNGDANFSTSQQWRCRLHQKFTMNSNRATRLIFKKLYLNVQYFDLGDIQLVGKLSERYTSFMLNIEADLAIFKGEFNVEQNQGFSLN